MSPDPQCVAPTTTVEEARALLRRYGFRHLPVVDRDRLVGVISDRDVAAGASPAEAIDTVMSRSPHVIQASDSVAAAARTLLSRRISALPVLEGDALVGMLTTTDCLLALLEDPLVV